MTYIVIVDDDRNILTSLRIVLQAENFEVATYHDPITALPKVIFEPPHVLILNGNMPRMKGIEFFKRFRQFSQTPVIFLASYTEEIQEKLEQDGMTAEAYIDKPFSQRLLVEIIRRVHHAHMLKTGTAPHPAQSFSH